jgi:phage FluMu protein Com
MDDLPGIRCNDCNRLLFYGFVKYVSIKCPKCGHIQTFKEQQIECACCAKEKEKDKWK